MMRRFPSISAARTPIGIDVGSHSIKAAQLRRRGAEWAVERAASFPRRAAGEAIDAVEAARLNAVLTRLGFRGQDVVLAIPPQQTLTAMLDLPPRGPGVPVEQIARSEFSRIHNQPEEALEIAFWDLPDPSRAAKSTHLMAVGTLSTGAEALIDILGEAGLNVVGLDHFTSAMARAVAGFGAGAGTTLLVDLGWSAATLALVSSGVLIYERRMPEIAGKLLFEALQKQFSMDAEEAALVLGQVSLKGGDEAPAESGSLLPLIPTAVLDLLGAHVQRLVQELRLALIYVGRTYADAVVSGVLLSGGGASLGGLEKQVEEQLEIPCRRFAPAAGECRPEVIPALGLAMLEETA